MLEAYEALADYRDMMELTEADGGRRGHGRQRHAPTIEIDGQPVDLAPPWRRATMYELIKEHAGIDIHPSMPLEEARRIADRGRGRVGGVLGQRARSATRSTTSVVEHLLVGPIFVLRPPARDLAAGARPPRRPDPGRALRGGRGRPRAGQRLQRADRPGRPARALRGRGPRQGRRRPRGRRRRRGLPARDGARACRPTGGLGVGRRPPGDAARRGAHDPRRHPLPDAAPRGRGRAPPPAAPAAARSGPGHERARPAPGRPPPSRRRRTAPRSACALPAAAAGGPTRRAGARRAGGAGGPRHACWWRIPGLHSRFGAGSTTPSPRSTCARAGWSRR